MATPTVYVICDQNCKWEGMTKEQILAAIAQAVSTGEIKDVDTGFVQTIKTINGTPLKFFVGEQSEYDALTEEEKENLFAIITNDTNKQGIDEAVSELKGNYIELSKGLANGSIIPQFAKLIKNNIIETNATTVSITENGLYLFLVKYDDVIHTSILWFDINQNCSGTKSSDYDTEPVDIFVSSVKLGKSVTAYKEKTDGSVEVVTIVGYMKIC